MQEGGYPHNTSEWFELKMLAHSVFSQPIHSFESRVVSSMKNVFRIEIAQPRIESSETARDLLPLITFSKMSNYHLKGVTDVILRY